VAGKVQRPDLERRYSPGNAKCGAGAAILAGRGRGTDVKQQFWSGDETYGFGSPIVGGERKNVVLGGAIAAGRGRAANLDAKTRITRLLWDEGP
jgi:hypothetical protein